VNALIEAIKASMIHFMAIQRDTIKSINNANQATVIIDSFNNLPHPLKEGLIAVRELYNIIDGEHFLLLPIHNAINNYLLTIKPYYLEEKLQIRNQIQQKNRNKRDTWGGLTSAQIADRNKRIVEKFKTSKLSANSFAENKAEEFGLSVRQLNGIISKSK
jgi:hypothetical protein